jgi:pSer/pThr/pTyr-binding forkhead associated (FHA) protein
VKSTALAQQPMPLLEATLTLLTGSGRGTVYRLVSARVRIGRGPDNDIVIDDPKMSRHHAELVATPRGFEIRDVTDKNVIVADGMECKAAYLKDSSVFALGETQFRLALKAHLPAPANSNQQLSPVGPGGVPGYPGQPGMPTEGDGRKRSRSGSRSGKKSSPMRWVFIALIIGIVWIGLTDTKKPQETALTADQRAEAEIQTAKQLKDAADARRPKDAAPDDVGYNQAQQAFVTGFRDYRKGQFERAMASFQACVSLHPSHDLCNRYLRLSQRRFDEVVQAHMVRGRKSRDQNQFTACAASFRNVMVMVKDMTSKRYQEAKANFEACQAQVEGRF